MRRLSPLRLIAITIFSFALTLVSNTLEPAVLGHKVLQLVPKASQNTALGFTTFAGLLVAVLVQPLIGVLSDRTRSRWGRRIPFLVLGVVLVVVCLLLIALAPVFGAVILGVLLIQVASNTVQGPWQALIPDQVPEAQRGRAAGLKAMFDILAFVIGRLVAGTLVGRFPEWGAAAIVAAVMVPAIGLVLALALTIWGAREPADTASERAQQTVAAAVRGTFAIDLRAHPAFGWWFANRLLFWGAFITLNTFLLFYAIDVVGLTEAQAQRYIGQLSTLLGGAVLVVTLPAGWLADRIGRRRLIVAAGLIAALGTSALVFTRSLTVITVGGVVIGLGVGLFLSANWALLTDIVPQAEAARYMGIANIATAGGSGLGRLLGGSIIDPINRATNSAATGYLVVYGVAAAMFALSALVMLRGGKDEL